MEYFGNICIDILCIANRDIGDGGMKINKELLKGSTSILVLSLLDKDDKYGYQLIQELKSASDNVFELKEGTLYPILHGLEEAGAIVSNWEETDKIRKRKFYSITENGRKLLHDKKKEWFFFTKSVNSVIGGLIHESPG